MDDDGGVFSRLLADGVVGFAVVVAQAVEGNARLDAEAASQLELWRVGNLEPSERRAGTVALRKGRYDETGAWSDAGTG